MKKYSYDYTRPAVTVDALVIAKINKKDCLLLIKRSGDPFKNKWALPGGFIDEGETLEAAARRELLEETGLKVLKLTQIAAFGNPGRDPRGWTVSIAFIARVNAKLLKIAAGSDASEVQWFPITKLPQLAFDHRDIIKTGLRFQRKLSANPKS